MDLKIGTILKAILIVAGLLVGSETVAPFATETMVNEISGALAVLGSVFYDVFETFRLKKQGIVSTSPAANVAAPGSPAALARKEDA